MINLKQNLKLIYPFLQTSIQAEWQYRFKSLAWIANGSITPLLLMSIWLIVGQNSKLAIDPSQIVTYYLLSIIMSRFTQVWSLEDIGKEIREGEISFKLVKPYHYLVEELGKALGFKSIRLLVLFPVIGMITLLLVSYLKLTLDPMTIFMALCAIILGFAINFFWENMLALLVIYVGENESLVYLNFMIYDFFSGRLIPFLLIPIFFRNFIYITPFRYFISFPIEILQHQLSFQKTLEGFGLGIAFLMATIFLYVFLFKKGFKKYSSFGH